MSDYYNFYCPSCKKLRQIELVQKDVVICTLVDISILDNEVEDEYYFPNVQEAYTDRYQCEKCGFVIAKDHEELVKFLKKNQYNWLLISNVDSHIVYSFEGDNFEEAAKQAFERLGYSLQERVYEE